MKPESYGSGIERSASDYIHVCHWNENHYSRYWTETTEMRFRYCNEMNHKSYRYSNEIRIFWFTYEQYRFGFCTVSTQRQSKLRQVKHWNKLIRVKLSTKIILCRFKDWTKMINTRYRHRLKCECTGKGKWLKWKCLSSEYVIEMWKTRFRYVTEMRRLRFGKENVKSQICAAILMLRFTLGA